MAYALSFQTIIVLLLYLTSHVGFRNKQLIIMIKFLPRNFSPNRHLRY